MVVTPVKPRVLYVALWSWWVAAALLMLGGLIAVAISSGSIRAALAEDVPTEEELRRFVIFYRVAGVICILLGVVFVYLANRILNGRTQFASATVVLSGATAALILVDEVLVGLPLPALLAALALLVAITMALQSDAKAWFDAIERNRRR